MQFDIQQTHMRTVFDENGDTWVRSNPDDKTRWEWRNTRTNEEEHWADLVWNHEIDSTNPKTIEELENTPDGCIALYAIKLAVREDECFSRGYEGYGFVKNGIIDLDGKTFLTKDPNIHIDYANKLAVFPRYPEEGMEVTVSVPEQTDTED